MAQERKSKSKGEQHEAREAPQGVKKTEGIDEDVDGILDEIDDVLETNAEDFVNSFIQKGGQ